MRSHANAPAVRMLEPPRAHGQQNARSRVPAGVARNAPYQPRRDAGPSGGHGPIREIVSAVVEFVDRFPVLEDALHGVGAVKMSGRPVDLGTPGLPVAADPPGAWTVAAIGDFGFGTPEQARVAAQIASANPELVVTTGDNVYPSGRWQDWSRHYAPEQFFGKIRKTTPVMPALGNHDVQRRDLSPYFGWFPFLKGQPYYGFVRRNATFLMLDSDQDLTPGSIQYRWLEEQLRTAKTTWKIVTLHYPTVGLGSERQFEDIDKALKPLFRKYGVQLVLNGHEHGYGRVQAREGVHQVITGGGGAPIGPLSAKRPRNIAFRAPIFHYTKLSIGDDRIVLRAVDQHGKVMDTVSIPATAGQQAVNGALELRGGRRARRRAG